MQIAIVSNISNGIGLQRDAALLSDWLTAHGHTATLHQFNEPMPPDAAEADLGLFLETISEHLIPLARKWHYVANCEWLKPEFIKPIQRHCECVIAKTRDAERTLRERFAKVAYTGFLTTDHNDPAIPREHRFLHIGGNSGHRNTNAVLAAWREYRWWNGPDAASAHLTVVSNSKTTIYEDTPAVTFIKRATDEEIVRLQNQCLFHVLPSAYEGWGQALHEAQSVGAVILTTGAGPMAEVKAAFEVPSVRTKRVNMGTLHEVSPSAIRELVPKMLTLPAHYIAQMRVDSRLRFEQGNKEFGERFGELLEGGTPRISVDLASSKPVSAHPPTPRLRLALLGNFGPEHSTENELLWTLRDMGHQVLPFQENEDTTEEILAACDGIALLIYVHTHGWETPGKMTVKEMLGRLGRKGVKTCSFHLDRYWDLNVLDRRQDRIGQHPFWHTDYVLTADGGNQERFRERLGNDRHRWLPPGVVKRECESGTFQPGLAIDIGFVGAEGYHPEYPFRGQLLEFLRGVYGERFRVFSGYRGQALNDLYASIKVVVGDSCFGGSPRYWSDRVPETVGRGGFLIHPASEGLTIPGLVTFEPGNLMELQDRVDYFVEHQTARERLRVTAQNWVGQFETYHNRMTEMLRITGCL